MGGVDVLSSAKTWEAIERIGNMGQSDAQLLKEKRKKLNLQISDYTKQRDRGESVNVAHERLRGEVEYHYGAACAEYFDLKGALPYVSNKAVPWPMMADDSRLFSMMRILVTFFVGALLITWVPAAVGMWLIAIGVAGAAIVYFLFPVVAGLPLLTPKDAEQRRQSMAEFTQIHLKHEAAQEEAATRARMQRLGEVDN